MERLGQKQEEAWDAAGERSDRGSESTARVGVLAVKGRSAQYCGMLL